MTRIILLAFALTLPLTANAVLIRIDYEGVVSSVFVVGGGTGYAVGDVINGALFIDTTLAPPDSRPDDPNVGFYDNLNVAVDSGFVTGYAPARALSSDSVEIWDLPGIPGIVPDLFGIRVADVEDDRTMDAAGNILSFASDLLQLQAFDTALPFINGEGLLQEFDLTSANLVFVGRAWRQTGVFDPSTHTLLENVVVADFNLRRLTASVAPPPSSVPEPGTLALLSVGLLGLIACARRREQLLRI